MNRQECWDYLGLKNAKGYGIGIHSKDSTTLAHRQIYEIMISEIPKGLTVDHLCMNKACINPMHLEVVPLKINILRGNGLAAINYRKTHCSRGHKFIPENTYIHGKTKNKRECRICRKLTRNLRTRRKDE